jgi:excinuclease UvrABC helicase subunit UvrB
MNTFDDLFDQFFGGKRNKKEKNGDDPLDFHKAKDENIKKLIEMISNMEEITNPETAGQIDEQLGEADRVEYYEEDGMYFEKKTWKVFGGEMVKVLMSDEPFNKKEEPTLTLEEQLEEAVKNEEYEIAAKLRDAIKKEEKKRKKIQKDLLF